MPRTIFLLAVAITACTSARTDQASSEPCVLAQQDSVYARTSPVFPACAVDRVARVKNARLERMSSLGTSRPQSGETCLTAEARFVVDEAGRPEPSTINIVSSNDPGLAEALRTSIPGWTYEPARINGMPVRQVVQERRAIVQMVVTRVSSTPGAGGLPPRPSASTCR